MLLFLGIRKDWSPGMPGVGTEMREDSGDVTSPAAGHISMFCSTQQHRKQQPSRLCKMQVKRPTVNTQAITCHTEFQLECSLGRLTGHCSCHEISVDGYIAWRIGGRDRGDSKGAIRVVPKDRARFGAV